MVSSRIVTCNIKNDTPDEPVARWTPPRHAAVAAVLREVDADVVALQEVLAHQLEDLRADLPEYVSIGVGRDDGAAAGEFVPLLVRTDRWTVREWGTFWLSANPELPTRYPGTSCYRVCTWAVLDPVGAAVGAADGLKNDDGDRSTGAVPLRVWNLHLDHESEDARTFGTSLVLERIAVRARAGTEPGAVDVVLGDLNAGPDSAPVRAALTALRDAREASVTAPTGPGATFHDWHPAAIADSGPEHVERIDYVLVGPGPSVRSYDVPTPLGPDGVVPSDHHPVVVELDL